MGNDHRYIVLHAETSTATGTLTGTSFAGLSKFHHADVVCAVTGGTGTFSFLVDSDFDGTNFNNIVRTNTLTTAGVVVVHLTRKGSSAVEVNVTADAGIGTIRNIGWRDAMRVRVVTTGTFTGTITAILST